MLGALPAAMEARVYHLFKPFALVLLCSTANPTRLYLFDGLIEQP
jgi:hypothetical protein